MPSDIAAVTDGVTTESARRALERLWLDQKRCEFLGVQPVWSFGRRAIKRIRLTDTLAGYNKGLIKTVPITHEEKTLKPKHGAERIDAFNAELWSSAGDDFAWRKDAYTEPELLLITGESPSMWEAMIQALWLYGPTNPRGVDESLGYVRELRL